MPTGQLRQRMATYQLQINFESGFTIDRENGLVRENGNAIADLLQTQVALIRDNHGRVIGTEVLHHCRAADATEFIIDESEIYGAYEDTELE